MCFQNIAILTIDIKMLSLIVKSITLFQVKMVKLLVLKIVAG